MSSPLDLTPTTDPDVRRRAGWLPAQQEDLEEWLTGHRDRVTAHGDRELHASVRAFAQLIEDDTVVGMTIRRMVEQVPESRAYAQRHLHSVAELLAAIDEVLTLAPEYGDEAVTIPLGAVLDWTMGTPAGFAAYRDPKVNAALRDILREWCTFLDSPESLYVLNSSDRGWTSAKAAADIGIAQFQHDPDDPHWGFSSWNDFFVRRFRDGVRPVAAPDDDEVVVNPCESTPYGLSTGVSRRDRFWLKGQPYSLQDMLANDEAVAEFVGGTVYQAFLSATDYHRWHTPVSGTIVRAYVLDGTYFSEADSLGSDATEPINSQSYLAHVATRALILIQADNPELGLVGFLAVGMSDVSSCVIGVSPGDHVTKGQETGYFQFGGSTMCLLFRPGVITEFELAALPRPHDPAAPVLRLHAKLATARHA